MSPLRRILLATLCAFATSPAWAEPKTLKVVPQSDLTVIDPMFGTAWISLIAGEMMYESLFTWDAKLQPRPMMVKSWATSPDGLVWRFTLRENLKFHSGEPVTIADVIASTKRWIALDSVGAKVGDVLQELSEIDANTVEFRLKKTIPEPAVRAGRRPCPLPRHHARQGYSFPRRHADTLAGQQRHRLRPVPLPHGPAPRRPSRGVGAQRRLHPPRRTA